MAADLSDLAKTTQPILRQQPQNVGVLPLAQTSGGWHQQPFSVNIGQPSATYQSAALIGAGLKVNPEWVEGGMEINE